MPAMATPPDTRERLLQAGLACARAKGVRAITVRGIAAEAGANLGSFVHHFGTREAFVGAVIERWYAPLFDALQLTAQQSAAPLEALRQALRQLVGWMVDNRAILARLVLDAAAGEVAVRRFARSIDSRHPQLLLQLIQRAQAAQRLRADDPRHQLLFLMSSLALPVLVFHPLAQAPGMVPPLVQALAGFTTDAAAIDQRLEWALKGLAP